jgi:hypothetical protein
LLRDPGQAALDAQTLSHSVIFFDSETPDNTPASWVAGAAGRARWGSVSGLKLPRFGPKNRVMMAATRLHCFRLPVFALLAVVASAQGRAQSPPAALLPPSQSTPQLPPSLSGPAQPVFTPPPPNNNAVTGVPAPAQQPLNLGPPPLPRTMPHLRPGEVALLLGAHFRPNVPITGGLHWRIYSDQPDPNGVFRLVREDRTPAPSLALPAGGYIVHVAFGLASAAKAVRLRNAPVQELFEIPAGGLRLEGRVGDVRIPSGQISFEIYRGSQFDPGEKRPIITNVMTGDVVLLPEGTYFIVSKYGDGNAVVRSDIRVQTGKLTDVTVTHRAAAIMLKLVARKGGEALADTEWAVVSPAGDVIAETKGAFPRVILAEGEYRVIARKDNRVYPPHNIKVVAGVDGEIEVLAR